MSEPPASGISGSTLTISMLGGWFSGGSGSAPRFLRSAVTTPTVTRTIAASKPAMAAQGNKG